MADNIINVKIREAYDTEANWLANNPKLLQGQVAISSDKHGMYKVGDGNKTWSQLDYTSHPASDVYSWAKAQTKPSYNASEINGSVTGVKGSSESSYRTGNVNITKGNIGLGNVENKSQDTIRGEITSNNVVTALGYTPLNKAGDSMSGDLTMGGNNIVGVNSIYTSGTSENQSEGIRFYRSSQTWDDIWATNGVLYFSPNASTSGISATNSQRVARFTTTPPGENKVVLTSDANGGIKYMDALPRQYVGTTSDGYTDGLDPMSRALVSTAASNKTFGLPASSITIEYSTDGGTTWVDYGASDADKIQLFSELRTSNFRLGKASTTAANSLNCWLRITVTPDERYMEVDSLYIWGYTAGNTWCVDLDASTVASKDSFTNLFTGHQLGGWSGNNIKYFNPVKIDGRSNATSSNYYKLRLTFRQTVVSTSGNYGAPGVTDIRFYGMGYWSAPSSVAAINMILGNHIYSWDTNYNVAFPHSIISGAQSNDMWNSVDVVSNSGRMQMFSYGNANGNGNRGIFVPAHGTGESKTVLEIDTNNNASFYGNATSATTASSATTAGQLTHKTLNSTTLSNTLGTFAFSGSGDPWPNSDWVGLQVGDTADKFQIVPGNSNLNWRQNDNGGTNSTDWGSWRVVADSGNISTGDGNGQIKIAGVNVSVKGLGSNAYTSTTFAPLDSPGLTGTPTAPTAITGTNTTQIATTAFVNSSLDQFQIGGRNLVLNQDDEVTSKNQIQNIALTDYGKEILVPNYVVTVSFDVKVDTPTDAKFDSYLRDSSGQASSQSPRFDGLTTEYQRMSYTANIIKSGALTIAFRTTAASGNGNTSATFTFRRIKVELGDTATDWTPAPEDYAVSGHTHKYAGSNSAGGQANQVLVSRVTEDANHAPGKNAHIVREYSNSSANLPSAHWYHIYESQGGDTNYATQLAIGMTGTKRLSYRRYYNSSWENWVTVADSSNVSTGDSNGQVKIAGVNVSVKGLGSNAYTSTEYLALAGTQTITGQKKIGATQYFVQTGVTKGTAPSSAQYREIICLDQSGDTAYANAKRLGQFTFATTAGNINYARMVAFSPTAGSNDSAGIGVYYGPDGSYTAAPTPVATDSSTKIATTAFVRGLLRHGTVAPTTTNCPSGCFFFRYV